MTAPCTSSAIIFSDSSGSLPRPRASALAPPTASTGIGRRKPLSTRLAVVRAVARDVAVEGEPRAQRAGLTVRAQVLVDVVGPEGIAPPREGLVEPGEIGTLAALHQRLRQVGCHVEGVVPALAALRDVGADAGQGHVDDGQRPDRVGVRRGKGEGHGSAPVVPDQMPARQAERAGQQLPEIAGDGLLVVAVERTRAVAEATQIRHDQPVTRREKRHDVPPLVPGRRPAVQEHHRVAGAGRDVVE